MPEMDNRIILSSTAKDELEVSYQWYEERSIGLGERFLDVIDNGLQLIRINPERFPKKNKEYRVCHKWISLRNYLSV